MPTYQIEEMENDSPVRLHVAVGVDARDALKRIVDRPVLPRQNQRHWYRVVDETRKEIYEFTYG
ncbi:hypothetical protein FKO01_06275 [Mesorhizobium sp. B2-3-3]|nr:hypothetical protein FKO01_06275 [Mesorhizobium sp. B2-3-3]